MGIYLDLKLLTGAFYERPFSIPISFNCRSTMAYICLFPKFSSRSTFFSHEHVWVVVHVCNQLFWNVLLKGFLCVVVFIHVCVSGSKGYFDHI
jgi:hypothetical protein